MNKWNDWTPEWINAAVLTMFNTLRYSQEFGIHKDELNTNKPVEI